MVSVFTPFLWFYDIIWQKKKQPYFVQQLISFNKVLYGFYGPFQMSDRLFSKCGQKSELRKK